MTTPVESRVPVSVICVYNDPGVLDSCLRRSIEAGLGDAPDTELIAVDNRSGAYATAGAALNHGARSARHAVVVFVHQDVVLHSLPALEVAAARMVADPKLGILGAVGIDSVGTIVGRMRDRVVRIGISAPQPVDVESLDEVLLMVPRDRVLRDPLSEDPLLAWHAYGVEYACRVRQAGERAVACDIEITHNSLTVNLARLDEAHQRVGQLHPELLPVQTTCGTIRGGSKVPRLVRRATTKLGSAVRWWGESRTASQMSLAGPVALGDIRQFIDQAVRLGGLERLTVVDCDVDAAGPSGVDDLMRFEFPFVVEAMSRSRVRVRIEGREDGEALLVVGLEPTELASVSLSGSPRAVGYCQDTGAWALVGADHDDLAPLLPRRRNRPYAGLVPSSRRPPEGTAIDKESSKASEARHVSSGI